MADRAEVSELAARCAVLAARLYEVQGWTWGGGFGDPGFIPDAEAIAQCIAELIDHDPGDRGISTGRLLVCRGISGVDVYLHLGTLDEHGNVDCDDQIKARRG